MKLDVPYYSQFLDIDDSFWILRACGAVSLAMVAEYEGIVLPDILAFCHEARERGGYHVVNGWVHDYVVLKARELGLFAYRQEGLTEVTEIISALNAGHPVIVSVEKRVLEQKRFHMLVVTGYEVDEQGAVTRLYYHEPESTVKEKGMHRQVDIKTFLEYFRGKAIFVSSVEK